MFPVRSILCGMTPDAQALTVALADTCWHTIEVVDSTGSTNADLIGRANAEGARAVAGTVRMTSDQTSGRGRHARAWTAPAGSQLAISAAVAVEDATAQLGWLSLLAGVAVADAIENFDGTEVASALKWPNDVLVGGAKISGILSEYTATDDGGLAVIGIGINTDMTREQLPVPTATSLAIAAGGEEPVDTTALAGNVLRSLASLLARWPEDIDAVAAAYRARTDTVGRRVRLILPDDTEVLGTAVDVDEHGRIVVEADGERVVAAAGDVTHLRVTED